jgi:Sec-independent protein translocase protein TatA
MSSESVGWLVLVVIAVIAVVVFFGVAVPNGHSGHPPRQ